MNDPLPQSANGTDPAERWEAQLLAVARALPYPATPNLAPAVLARTGAALPVARLAPRRVLPRTLAAPRRAFGLALAAVLVVALSLLAVPTVRSGVIDFLELGAV